MKFSANKYQCSGTIVLLPCSIIKPNTNCTRNISDDNEIDSLAASVRINGIIQPLAVRYIEKSGYEIISGERRLYAAKKVGLSTVPCIIMNVTECESLFYSLIENLQRKDLNFFEEADAYLCLSENFKLSQEEIARRLGKSQSAVSNKMRLLRLSTEVKTIIIDNSLTERHARALLKIDDNELQIKALSYIIKKDLNVNETENYIDLLVSPVEPSRSQPQFKKLKDIKIFINTINHAVDTMRKAGINALSSENETPDYYEYVVRIPKMTTSPVSSCEAV